jgi:shikimate kinase
MSGSGEAGEMEAGGPLLARPVALVGLMGAGKTSVGRRLAELLSAPFVDSDVEIALAAGMSVPEIFATYGEPEFRDGERRVIARLLAGPPCVLATGGGAFVQERTRGDILELATSVWLRADLDVLWDRVRDRPGRPLLEAPDPKAVLAELDRTRSPIYALADVTVESRRGVSHLAMARAIIAALRARDAEMADGPSTLREIAA